MALLIRELPAKAAPKSRRITINPSPRGETEPLASTSNENGVASSVVVVDKKLKFSAGYVAVVVSEVCRFSPVMGSSCSVSAGCSVVSEV